MSWYVIIIKSVFYFNRFVAKRSVFYCVHVIGSASVLTRNNEILYALVRHTIEMEDGLNVYRVSLHGNRFDACMFKYHETGFYLGKAR